MAPDDDGDGPPDGGRHWRTPDAAGRRHCGRRRREPNGPRPAAAAKRHRDAQAGRSDEGRGSSAQTDALTAAVPRSDTAADARRAGSVGGAGRGLLEDRRPAAPSAAGDARPRNRPRTAAEDRASGPSRTESSQPTAADTADRAGGGRPDRRRTRSPARSDADRWRAEPTELRRASPAAADGRRTAGRVARIRLDDARPGPRSPAGTHRRQDVCRLLAEEQSGDNRAPFLTLLSNRLVTLDAQNS